MEARGLPQHRTQVKPVRLACLGERAGQRDTRYPIVAGQYWGRRRREVVHPYSKRSLRVRQRAVEPKEATTRA